MLLLMLRVAVCPHRPQPPLTKGVGHHCWLVQLLLRFILPVGRAAAAADAPCRVPSTAPHRCEDSQRLCSWCCDGWVMAPLSTRQQDLATELQGRCKHVVFLGGVLLLCCRALLLLFKRALQREGRNERGHPTKRETGEAEDRYTRNDEPADTMYASGTQQQHTLTLTLLVVANKVRFALFLLSTHCSRTP